MNAPIRQASAMHQAPLRDQFARNLRLWRHERAMSQAQLAEAAGLSRPFVNSIERGHFSVSLETLELLAGGLRVEPAMLIVPLGLSQPRRNLRSIREEKGLSQSELAVASGLSRFHINRIESGKATPGSKARNALAQALGVAPSTIS